MNDSLQVYVANRKEWRRWLSENYQKATEVWLVFPRKWTGIPAIPYNDAVEEALCFGWIDSKVKRLDEERYIQWYSPRKDDSNWSESNKKRVEKLIDLGLMTPAGQQKIEIAKRNGSWDRLDDIDRDPKIPRDLATALAKNPAAKENFEQFAPSYRKQYLWWLKSARQPETRTKRIIEIVERAEKNIKPGI